MGINFQFSNQNWTRAIDLGLENEDIHTWEIFIKDLKDSHIHLSDNQYLIVWENNANGGIYTPKMGYRAIQT